MYTGSMLSTLAVPKDVTDAEWYGGLPSGQLPYSIGTRNGGWSEDSSDLLLCPEAPVGAACIGKCAAEVAVYCWRKGAFAATPLLVAALNAGFKTVPSDVLIRGP